MKRNCSIILALVAITVSLASLFVKDNAQVTMENFALALISVCATLIVGVSVIDVLSLHRISNRLKEIDNIQNDVSKTMASIEDMKKHTNVALHITWGLVFVSWKPRHAIFECLNGLVLALEEEDVYRVNTCLEVLDTIVMRIENDNQLLHQLQNSRDNKQLEEFEAKIRAKHLFKVFKGRIVCLFNNLEKLLTDNY